MRNPSRISPVVPSRPAVMERLRGASVAPAPCPSRVSEPVSKRPLPHIVPGRPCDGVVHPGPSEGHAEAK